MAFYPRLNTLADIREKAYRVEIHNGKPTVRIDVGPDIDNLVTFNREKNPDWGSSYQSDTGSSGFTGTASYAEAIDLLRNGWKQGVADMLKLKGAITANLHTAERVKMVYIPSVAPIGGLQISIPAVISSSPCPYVGRISTKKKVKGQKIVRMAVNMSMSGGVDEDVIKQRGGAILAVVHYLELAGYSVDMQVFDTAGTHSGKRLVSMYHCKPAGERINLDRIAFAVGHPSMLRRVFFSMTEHVQKKDGVQGFCGSYGQVVPLNEALSPKEVEKFSIIVDSECAYSDETGEKHARWEDTQAQVAWVKSQLAKFGVKIGGCTN